MSCGCSEGTEATEEALMVSETKQSGLMIPPGNHEEVQSQY